MIGQHSLLPIRMMFRDLFLSPFPLTFIFDTRALLTILLLLSHILIFLFHVFELSMLYVP